MFLPIVMFTFMMISDRIKRFKCWFTIQCIRGSDEIAFFVYMHMVLCVGRGTVCLAGASKDIGFLPRYTFMYDVWI